MNPVLLCGALKEVHLRVSDEDSAIIGAAICFITYGYKPFLETAKEQEFKIASLEMQLHEVKQHLNPQPE